MGRASNRKKTMTRAERLRGARLQAPRGVLDQLLHITAYHEAGHITCAEALGHRVQFAWVDLRGRRVAGTVHAGHFEHDALEWSRGLLSPADVADPARWRYLYSRLIVATAGIVSEVLYCRRAGVERPEDRESDRDQYVPLAMLLSAEPAPNGDGWVVGADAERLPPGAAAQAERILTARWDAVAALAEALMHKGDLSGDEVRAALAPAGGLRPALHLDWPLPGTPHPSIAAG